MPVRAHRPLRVREVVDRRREGHERADDSPDWLAYYDEAYLAAKIAHCFRDLSDDTRTATYAAQSLDMADGYLRGRSFNLCLLAGAYAVK